MKADNRLPLSIALTDNPRTRPIIEGRVEPDGIRLMVSVVDPSEMFWRQLRFAEFDVSEMSLSSLFITTARGDRRWVGLPIYTMRRFFHTWAWVRTDRGIAQPADLRGKRVGVPEYQQTAAIWSRGVLQHEFGVHPGEIEWFMERTAESSHGGATGFTPPPGVRVNRISASTNIGEMLVSGALDATLLYINRPNIVDRSRIDLAARDDVRPLFADRIAEGRRFFRKTGIYPINHGMVVQRRVYEQAPWVALNLLNAFNEAKRIAVAEAAEGLQAYEQTGLVEGDLARLTREDPMPYGVVAARKVLETVAEYVHEQGLSDRVVALEEVFAENTIDV